MDNPIRACVICSREFVCPSTTPNPLIRNICPDCLAEIAHDESMIQEVMNGDYR